MVKKHNAGQTSLRDRDAGENFNSGDLGTDFGKPIQRTGLARSKTDDPDKRKRVVQALTVRISLSIGLFVALVASFYFGLIPGRD